MFENNPFATHTVEILVMLLGAFLIGLWLGWVLWGRLKVELDKLRVENQSLTVTLDALRIELETLKTRALVAESDNSNLTTQIAGLNRDNISLRERALYLEAELADVQSRNRQVETELGLSYTPDTPIADDIPLEIKTMVVEQPAPEASSEPETPTNGVYVDVPTEAQEMPTPPVFLVEPVALIETKPEKPAKQRSSAPAAEPAPAPTISAEKDDLTVVEGIGPKIQMLLNQYGIFTYRQLADADVLRLKEILSTAGPQLAMHDPGTWPSQANLAANDQWDTLKSVQGFLKGGKKPD
jgi:predicted flap endonuclease-1-like 5' DNA nuclease